MATMIAGEASEAFCERAQAGFVWIASNSQPILDIGGLQHTKPTVF